MTERGKRQQASKYQRAYYQSHKEELRAYNREYHRKYRKTLKWKRYQKAYEIENKSHIYELQAVYRAKIRAKRNKK